MRGAIQSLPSSGPWLVLPRDRNPRMFPKKLDSKTSSLRIKVPDNLDLALEGLIRKVLREQPKVDDIYGFAADYFDALLKIREEAGTKFIDSQICPFHNDEDAHEMIKLANSFEKPARRETPKIDKTKNDAKEKRKESVQSAGKTEKKTLEKKPRLIQKKPAPGTEKKVQKKVGSKEEPPKTLKLEPKTEDVGEDEEFLKSDPIKALVEKELMDSAKSRPKEKENAESQMEGKDKPEEATPNEELCAVVDKDSISVGEKKTNETIETKKEEKEHQQHSLKEDEEVKKEEEKIETETQKAPSEIVIEAQDAVEENAAEDVKKELENSTKNAENSTGNAEIQGESLEIITKNDGTSAEEIEKETQKSPGDDKTKIETEEIKEADENHKAAKEVIEENTENTPKDETAEEMKTETKNVGDDKAEEETNVNPDELCSVVDILSIKPPESEEIISKDLNEAKAEESEPAKETLEVKSEAEMPVEAAKEVTEVQTSAEFKPENPDRTKEAEEVKTEVEGTVENEKEVSEVQTSAESMKTTNDSKEAEKEKESTISPNEEEISDKQENVEVKTDEPETENAIENLKVPTETEDSSRSQEEMGEKKEESEPEQPAEQKSIEDDKITQESETNKSTNEAKDEEEINKENTAERAEISEDAKELNTGGSNSAVSDTIKEEEVNLQEKPTENAEIKEQASPSEKTETTAEMKSNESVKPAENEMEITPPEAQSIEMEKETQEPVQKAEETNISSRNTEDYTAAPEKDKDETPEETNNVQEKETGPEHVLEKEVQNKEPTTETPEEVEKTTEIAEEEKQENEAAEHHIEKREIATEAENITETSTEETIKTESEPLAAVNPEESAVLQETNKTPEDEPSAAVNAVEVKVENVDGQPSDKSQPDGVQIKTIQTHYYDTLQIPQQLTKKFRVHPVEETTADNLLNFITPILPVRETTETPTTPTEMDLEDSLLTPLSNYSLNVSELSVQSINEMFLDNEKQYNSLDREEKKEVTKPGETCEEKGVVEEIIHKTVVPPLIGATPIAPRDEVDINREESVENIKQETSMDSAADSSNEGRSIDSDAPVISVEVKTVIETQILDEEDEKKEEDVKIRIEATIDVPEGMVVELEEKKESKENDAKDEAASSEGVPKAKGSVQSSRESESSISSAATEIKRTMSKRHFSSTRTLLTTQSLDLDNRTPLLKTRSLSSFRQGVTDFEVWNAIEKELEEAATKIQSNFRGYKTRKKLQRENAVQITTEESSCSTTPVEMEPREEQQQSTGEFHDTIVLSDHPH